MPKSFPEPTQWNGGPDRAEDLRHSDPPEAEPRGYACPQCGAAVVIMSAACQVIAAPDGSMGVLDGFEWLPISSAKCYAACGWFGQAKDAELSEFGQLKKGARA